MRILVIEDNPKIARALAEGLGAAGYDVAVATTGEEGYFQFSGERFDLVVLDWMLPGRDGIEVLETLRGQGCDTPVLLLTARDAVEDRVRGLDAGADDYLVKPFAFAELEARIRSLLRRAPPGPIGTLTVGRLTLDALSRRVALGDRELNLTLREFDLLQYLMRHVGRVVSREMLARDVWEETRRATPLDNVIDVHMARLRRKLGEPDAQGIRTVRGVGFLLEELP